MTGRICVICGKPLIGQQRTACSNQCRGKLSGGFKLKRTPEQERQIRELWSAVPRLSTRVIGDIMGITKNAVVGMANRMDLPKRPSPINRSGIINPPKPRPYRDRSAPQPTPPAEPPRVPTPLLRIAPPPPPQTAPIRTPQLGSRRCQWTDSDSRPWVFCNHRTVLGHAWCDTHYRRVYVKTRRDLVAA